jgi:hypothetical protein
MSRKVDGTERSGRGTAPSAAGGFGGADTSLVRLGRPYVPKPFRSTGGMSTSADSTFSVRLGQHNTDQELPDDQVNINGIVDRKVSDRRYLPRKRNNMKSILNKTSLTEALHLDEDEISVRLEQYQNSINEFAELDLGQVKDFLSMGKQQTDAAGSKPIAPSRKDALDASKSILDTAGQFLAARIPFGDVYYGFRAYGTFKEIKVQAAKLEELIGKSGVDANLMAPPSENVSKIRQLFITSAADRAVLKKTSVSIALKCYDFFTDLISTIPLEVFPPLALLDTAIDVGISATATVVPDEKLALSLLDFALKYNETLRSMESKIGAYLPGDDFSQLNQVTNFIGNLALIHGAVSSAEKELETAEDPDVLAERRRRKKKRSNEMSMTANIAGYVGPMAAPKDPKQFYGKMARAAGGEYLTSDPAKTLRSKP